MMNKPLKDWTLGELKEYCNGRNCEDCCFELPAYQCKLDDAPCNWNLSTPPRWTAEDIKDAKAVKRVLPWTVRVGRSARGVKYISDGSGNNSRHINAVLFPGLRMGETVDLQEILDAEGKETVEST